MFLQSLLRWFQKRRASSWNQQHGEAPVFTEEMIGKTASAVMAISAGGAGRVALKGTTWRAILNDETAVAAVGDKVVVVSIEGVTLTVRKE